MRRNDKESGVEARPQMLRNFTFRLLPNATQRAALEYILKDNCETYNACLQERKEAWKLQRKMVGYYDQQKELSELRKDSRFAVIASDIQRDALRRIDRAFQGFFRRFREGGTPGYPRFKKYIRSFSFNGYRPTVRERSIRIPNIGHVRMRGGRTIEGIAKSVTVTHKCGHWNAVVACEIGPVPAKAPANNPIGMDLGVKHLISLSNGGKIENERWGRRYKHRLASAQKALSRKRQKSRSGLKALEKLRRITQKIANSRANHLHHVSKFLVNKYDLIAHEDLNVLNLNGLKMGFGGKYIVDASWGKLIWMITYKAASAGKWVIPVNPRGTSQRCSACGLVVRKKIKEDHECKCGLSLCRDENAARNILKLGTSFYVEAIASMTGACA